MLHSISMEFCRSACVLYEPKPPAAKLGAFIFHKMHLHASIRHDCAMGKRPHRPWKLHK